MNEEIIEMSKEGMIENSCYKLHWNHMETMLLMKKAIDLAVDLAEVEDKIAHLLESRMRIREKVGDIGYIKNVYDGIQDLNLDKDKAGG